MPWRLIIAPRAERDMEALSRRDRTAVMQALDRLAGNLGWADIKKLVGRSSEWRMRVGRWRVLLDLDKQASLISVTRVLPRGRAYRR